MKLFTVGPVMMYDDTLEARGEQVPYFRNDSFSELMLDSERMLKHLMGTDPSSRVAFLTASGTGAMDAVISAMFSPESRVLVIAGGSFGHRFAEICGFYGVPADTLELQFGEVLTAERLEAYDGRSYDALLVNIDETSVGQLYDIRLLSDFCRRNGAYLVVDAISSFAADPLHMDADGIDAVIISSQKALALSPGISAVVVNRRTYEYISSRRSGSYYLDLNSHFRNQERGQTPFTPAVGILIELNRRLHVMEDEGIDSIVSRTRELALYFRKLARENGFRIPDIPLSNAVTPLYFESGAYDIYRRLESEYSITVTPSGGDMRDHLLRIGHMGNLKSTDYDELIKALKEVIG